MDLLYLAIILLSLLLVLFLFLFIKKNRRNKMIKESLEFTLFSVKMSGITNEEIRDSGKQEKDWIKSMEDFYSVLNSLSKESLFGVDPWISMEIVKLKEEIVFYVAVPRRFENFIEKEIYSLYPSAQIEKSDDYSIFSLGENVCCGYLKTTKPFYLPIKTYNHMDTDPLSTITNVFTKLKSHEEAAVQIVIKKSSNNWRERGRMIINEVSRGKNLNQAMGATNFISSIKGKNENNDHEYNLKVDENLLNSLESKINKNT
ncbi:MAG: hypothetical protein PHV29_03915, partial [Candidatus Pacebacteria bacterium]|nr:hypothetical protein [Candidatus Paceibacterota bacterium]